MSKMSKIQYLSISVTALWAYDYFLTLKDEVTELYDDNDAEMNIITLYRSVKRGKFSAQTFGLFLEGPN